MDECEWVEKNQSSSLLPEVVFHIPHDGDEFPKELIYSRFVPENVFYRYHEEMRDKNVVSLVPAAYRHYPYSLCFGISRLLCDVERFTGPEEVMEQYGMGFCYERAYDGRRIKRISQELKDAAMVYYRRHHAALDRIVEKSENLLLIDLHSFSEAAIPRGYLETLPRACFPDICIGADPVYTPVQLQEEAERLFREAGFSTAVNFPYQGCMVPNAVLNKRTEHPFAGIMLEVNRLVYLNAQGEVEEQNAGKIREVIKKLIRRCRTYSSLA